jgi:A/G-specific adenine glycosylase
MKRSTSLLPAPTPSTWKDTWDRAAFARDLCAWFSQHQRDLPWRRPENARDGFRVLVSEVMLQQTTVAAVIPFYNRFLERFPTLQVLAEAEIDEVLPLWAGLGYYSRARNLHAAAHAIVQNHGGVFPRELPQVLALPGVGRYTAGAVTSIAFDAPSPIVDANVARVLSRVRAIEGDIKSPATLSQIWSESQKVVEAAVEAGHKPSEFNPAMMELGALICRPREPLCEQCPVAPHCLARAQNRQDELPHQTPRAALKYLRDACALAVRVVDGHEEILMRQRSHDPGAWWRGMWELPRTTVNDGETPQSALEQLLRELDVEARIEEKPLHALKHGITKYEVALECFETHAQVLEEREDVRWVAWEEAQTLAVPSPMKKMMEAVRRKRAAGQQTLFEIE